MTTPPRTALYDRHDLFDGWQADDPTSYTQTLDAQIYRQAVIEGLRSPSSDHVANERAVHDTSITRLLHDRLHMTGRRPVAIMGGHALARSSETYAATAHLAAQLSAVGLTVLTGGGPGAMEASHLGARLGMVTDRIDDALAHMRHDIAADTFPLGPGQLMSGYEYDPDALARLHRWQAPAFALAEDTDDVANETIGIPTWLYGHEPPTPLATEHAKYFENSIREDGLLALATNGIVFMPGRAGTVQEIFQDAAQNRYRTVFGIVSPMVFYDHDGYWTEQIPVKPVLDALFKGDDEARIHWSTDIDEIVEILDTCDPFPNRH